MCISHGMAATAAAVKAITLVSSTAKACSAKAFAAGRLSLLLQPAGEQRHEGGVESPFADDAAEHVGQPKRHEEGVGDRLRRRARRQSECRAQSLECG